MRRILIVFWFMLEAFQIRGLLMKFKREALSSIMDICLYYEDVFSSDREIECVVF